MVVPLTRHGMNFCLVLSIGDRQSDAMRSGASEWGHILATSWRICGGVGIIFKERYRAIPMSMPKVSATESKREVEGAPAREKGTEKNARGLSTTRCPTSFEQERWDNTIVFASMATECLVKEATEIILA